MSRAATNCPLPAMSPVAVVQYLDACKSVFNAKCMSEPHPSLLRRLRLPLSSTAIAGAALAMMVIGLSGAPAGAVPQPAASVSALPSQTFPAPSPGLTTPGTSPFPPSAPTDLTATQVTRASITLTWTASRPGCCLIEGYTITVWPAFNDYGWVERVGNVTTATLASQISPGTEYELRIAATDTHGRQSPWSDSIDVVTPVAASGDTVPPPAPTDLTAGRPTPDGVPLFWTPPADTSDIVGYNVYGFDGWFVSTLLGTTTGTTFTAAGVTGTRPQYYVRSRDAAGNVSLSSNTVPALPEAPSPSIPVSPTPSLSPSLSPDHLAAG